MTKEAVNVCFQKMIDSCHRLGQIPRLVSNDPTRFKHTKVFRECEVKNTDFTVRIEYIHDLVPEGSTTYGLYACSLSIRHTGADHSLLRIDFNFIDVAEKPSSSWVTTCDDKVWLASTFSQEEVTWLLEIDEHPHHIPETEREFHEIVLQMAEESVKPPGPDVRDVNNPLAWTIIEKILRKACPAPS